MDFSRQPKDVEKFKELVNSFSKSIGYEHRKDERDLESSELEDRTVAQDQPKQQDHVKRAQVEKISAPSHFRQFTGKMDSDDELEF